VLGSCLVGNVMDENTPVGGYFSDNHSRVMREWELRNHIGQVLTIIDSIGLPEKQEKAIKDLIKQATWKELWHNGGTPVIMTEHAQNLLVEAINAEYQAQTPVPRPDTKNDTIATSN
jgi:hypothetical protein